MNLTAVVVAGERPGGIDTLTPVAGVPMVARAVRALLAAFPAGRVVVLEVADRHDAVRRACAGLPVSLHDGLRHALSPVGAHAGPGWDRRAGTGAPGRASGGIVLLHDAARALTPPALAVAVVDALGAGHAVVAPVLPLSDTVKQVDRDGLLRATPDRSGLRVMQTPQAFRHELPDTGPEHRALDAAALHLAAGGVVHTVPGHPMAFPVRTAWDLELAELLVDGAAP